MFRLERFREEIASMEGFGEKSCENLLQSAKKASHTTLPRLIYSLGIPGIGLANAKVLCRHFGYDLEAMRRAEAQELTAVDGIGGVLAQAWSDYFRQEDNNRALDHLLEYLQLEEAPQETEQAVFAGMNFVITGSLEHFSNRKELQAEIENRGGKVTGSVTSKTNWLINNDTQSASSKNKKARELGIPVISEEEFLKML